MSISFPLDLPLGRNFQSFQLTEFNAATRNTSPFSQQEQIYMHDGDRWFLSFAFPSLAVEDAREILGFLSSMRGPFGTFKFRDPFMSTPAGTPTGTPVVDGADQTGYTVTTAGWTPNSTNILRRGDMIGIGTGYHRVTQDADSDSSGNADIEIWPSLRAPDSGDSIVTTDAEGTFRLDGQGYTYTVSNAGVYSVAVNCVEDT